MPLDHLFGIMLNPTNQWEKIRNDTCSVASCFLKHGAILAAIPAISAFIGATKTGWEIGGTEFLLTQSSTIPLVLGFYIACVLCWGDSSPPQRLAHIYIAKTNDDLLIQQRGFDRHLAAL